MFAIQLQYILQKIKLETLKVADDDEMFQKVKMVTYKFRGNSDPRLEVYHGCIVVPAHFSDIMNIWNMIDILEQKEYTPILNTKVFIAFTKVLWHFVKRLDR